MKELVITHSNWADEMDVEGFQIWAEGLATDCMQKLREAPPEFWNEANEDSFYADGPEIYIGTNEQISFSSFNVFAEAIRIKQISDNDAARLVDLFANVNVHVIDNIYATYGFGFNFLGSMMELYQNWIDGPDEDDEEDEADTL